MNVEENWFDGGVFFASLEMKENSCVTKINFSRMFTLKDCFEEKEAINLILKNFPNILRVIHIDYVGECHILKKI